MLTTLLFLSSFLTISGWTLNIRSNRIFTLVSRLKGTVDEYNEDGDGELESLEVYNPLKKRARDNRDNLPYYVDILGRTTEGNSLQRLGIFSLDRNTQSGDLVTHKQTNYEVKRVRSLYRFRSGSFELFRKKAEVMEYTRAMEERFLSRVIQIEFSGGDSA
jgi:hypothetical protein